MADTLIVKNRLRARIAHRLIASSRRTAGRALSPMTSNVLNSSGSTKILVAAPRRSGHHAVINWLMSAFEGSPVHWTTARTVTASPTGSTVFVNDISATSWMDKHLEVARHRRDIRSARVVITSFEDLAIGEWRKWPYAIHDPKHRIYVRRPTLDLVASRMKHPGGYTPVNEAFLKTLLDNESHVEGWIVIDFDTWVGDVSYRQKILSKMGLEFDSMPHISPHGNGSSFTELSDSPSPSDLSSRRFQVDWPSPVVELLLDPRFQSLLRRDEVDFLRLREEEIP